MKAASRFVPGAATLVLHAALVAATILGLNSRHKDSVPLRPVTVKLIQDQPRPPAPLPAAPVAPAPPSPAKKQPASKPRAAPKPKPKEQVRESVPPQIKAPEASFVPKPSTSATTSAAVAPATPTPAPASPAPVKTGVSISASYAATNRKPPYPRISRQNEEQGVVGLRVFVKADGTAGTVEVVSPSGYPLLDESARSTVQTWRFNPATADGKPVGEWYRVSIPFKLQD